MIEEMMNEGIEAMDGDDIEDEANMQVRSDRCGDRRTLTRTNVTLTPTPAPNPDSNPNHTDQVEKVVEELTAGMFEGADVSNVPTAAPAAATAAEEPTQARGAAEEPVADEAEVNALRDRLQAL